MEIVPLYNEFSIFLSVAVITVMLALSVYQLIVSEFLPVSSAHVPVIGQSAVLHFDMPNISCYSTVRITVLNKRYDTVRNAT